MYRITKNHCENGQKTGNKIKIFPTYLMDIFCMLPPSNIMSRVAFVVIS